MLEMMNDANDFKKSISHHMSPFYVHVFGDVNEFLWCGLRYPERRRKKLPRKSAKKNEMNKKIKQTLLDNDVH